MTSSTAYVDYEWLETGVNINHFRVDPDRRRQDHGTTVLVQLLAAAANAGAEYIVVNMKGGEPARQFLEHHGFEIVEHHSSDGHVTGLQDPVRPSS